MLGTKIAVSRGRGWEVCLGAFGWRFVTKYYENWHVKNRRYVTFFKNYCHVHV